MNALDVLAFSTLLQARDAAKGVLSPEEYEKNSADVANVFDIAAQIFSEEKGLDLVRTVAPTVIRKTREKGKDEESALILFLAGALEWIERNSQATKEQTQ